MDILSHGLWASAAAKGANLSKKSGRTLNAWRAFFWGVFPDLFAFTIPFSVLILGTIMGTVKPGDFPAPDSIEPAPSGISASFQLASRLYNFSHSLVIFAVVFALVWLRLKRPVFEMGGWLLHILLDIPTHSYRFYPTPFLWPISDFKVDGFSWGQPWFIALNYGALFVVFIALAIRKRRRMARD